MVNDCSMENGSCQTHLNFTRLCVLVNKCFAQAFVMRYKSFVPNPHSFELFLNVNIKENYLCMSW